MQRVARDPIGAALTTVESDLAGTTTPAGETWVYTYIVAQNVDGAAAATYSLYVTNGTQKLELGAKNTPLGAGAGLVLTEGPEIILPAGWRFRGAASANGDVTITAFGYKLTADPAP